MLLSIHFDVIKLILQSLISFVKQMWIIIIQITNSFYSAHDKEFVDHEQCEFMFCAWIWKQICL